MISKKISFFSKSRNEELEARELLTLNAGHNPAEKSISLITYSGRRRGWAVGGRQVAPIITRYIGR
jgi:hypothetical protein